MRDNAEYEKSPEWAACFLDDIRCTEITNLGRQCERQARWRVAGVPNCTHHAHEQRARLAAERAPQIAHRLNGPRRPAPDPRRRRAEWVYFIQVAPDGPIKIGKAVDPDKRIRELQTACPYPLAVLAVTQRWTESELHNRFAYLRLRGEWFHPGEDLVACIATVSEVAA